MAEIENWVTKYCEHSRTYKKIMEF